MLSISKCPPSSLKVGLSAVCNQSAQFFESTSKLDEDATSPHNKSDPGPPLSCCSPQSHTTTMNEGTALNCMMLCARKLDSQ